MNRTNNINKQLNFSGLKKKSYSFASTIHNTFTQQTACNALNFPVTLTQLDATLLYYAYDKGGLLNVIQQNNTEVHISNIEYNEKQQRLNIYYGNNTKTKYEYNPLNFRLTRILTTRNSGQDILQDLNYSYDAVGNIIQQTDNAQQTNYFNNQVIASTGTYQYDALYRLVQATGRELTSLAMPSHEDFPDNIPCPNPTANAMQNYTQQYQYDKLGNIMQMKSDHWTRNYVYQIGKNYLLKHDEEQSLPDYTYDAHGNMLSMPYLSSMVWDEKDQLHSATNGTLTSYYNYDAQGNRTRKVVDKAGGITETRYYIGGYEVFRKENSTADFERTTLNISDDEKTFVRIETKTGESPVIRYQYDNHLGSACLELDDTGDIISYEEYHPFGTTSYRSGRTEIEVSLKRYKYCGKERDEETGLYYYGMRYYAAWLCRFVSVDPLQFKYPHYTPYQYAGNKPITFIDLDGGEEDKPRTHTEINTFTNIQPINTYTKNGNTYQSVDYSFYQTTTTTDSETSMVYSAQESLSAQLTLRFISPSGEWALESVDSYTHNLTETFIENTTPTTDNSWGVMDYIHLGLDLVGLIPVVGEFFDAANALEIAETTLKESRNLWQLTEKGSLSIKHHSKYGNFYKGTDNLWWSVDKAKHGDSSFKVFQEKDKGLEWIHNADKYGDFITNQHKSNTGQFIPWKNLNTVK